MRHMKMLYYIFFSILLLSGYSCQQSNEFYFDQEAGLLISKGTSFRTLYVETLYSRDSIEDGILWYSNQENVKKINVKKWNEYFFNPLNGLKESPFSKKQTSFYLKIENISSGDRGEWVEFFLVDTSGLIIKIDSLLVPMKMVQSN